MGQQRLAQVQIKQVLSAASCIARNNTASDVACKLAQHCIVM